MLFLMSMGSMSHITFNVQFKSQGPYLILSLYTVRSKFESDIYIYFLSMEAIDP